MKEALKAEVLVPDQFIWWTLLALSADLLDDVREMSFVSDVSSSSDVVIADAHLLDRVVDSAKDKVIIVLWDGYQSYVECKALIDKIYQTARDVELRVVGDPWHLTDNHALHCRPMFAQDASLYDETLLSPARMRKVSFGSQFAKLGVINRSRLISLKVLSQILAGGLRANYKRTKYVYCGQSGLSTLEKYAEQYGIRSDEFVGELTGSDDELRFVVRWISAVKAKSGYWANDMMLRALLRYIALRTLVASRKQSIFLNLYPERNLNAYQAGLLFRSHVFLDFGGINGGEAIYPRSADLLMHKRDVIRFDIQAAVEQLNCLSAHDETSVREFVSSFEKDVLLQLDRTPDLRAMESRS